MTKNSKQVIWNTIPLGMVFLIQAILLDVKSWVRISGMMVSILLLIIGFYYAFWVFKQRSAVIAFTSTTTPDSFDTYQMRAIAIILPFQDVYDLCLTYIKSLENCTIDTTFRIEEDETHHVSNDKHLVAIQYASKGNKSAKDLIRIRFIELTGNSTLIEIVRQRLSELPYDGGKNLKEIEKMVGYLKSLGAKTF